MRFTRLWIMLMAFGLAAVPVRAAEEPVTSAEEAEEERPFADLEDSFNERQKKLMTEFQAWYDKSREYGEKGKEWVANDIKNIGDWEYLIVTLEAADEAELSRKLNAYGQQRWEAYWVQKKIHGVQFYFKRPVRTYIKHIPVGDLLHMIPNSQ